MKRATIFFLLGILIGFFTMSCNSDPAPSIDKENRSEAAFDLEAMEKIIREKTNQFTEAHITRDTAFLNAIFSKDAKIYAPNSEMVTGSAAIAAGNAEWVSYGIEEFSEESISFYGNEDFLIDEGIYYLSYSGIVDKGSYINIWKKENGDWKISSNIWNTDLPLSLSE
jgi:ketosteroid isomerase-like protein